MSALASIVGPMLAIVFAVAAAAKARPAGFRELVTLLRAARLLPAARAAPAAVVLIAAEAVTAACLAHPATVRFGLAAAGLLLVVLTAGLAVALRRRVPLSCSCFGSGGGPIGVAQLGRNLVLLACAAVGWAGAAGARPSLVAWAAAAFAAALLLRLDDLHDLLAPATPRRSRFR
ncbi:MauE/DoxX family redox-associated membrane protein [Polymorphospora sp. NPDC050346]|uniref:MauE/DoxX family redox-associated membrane protein n=1 Tax=Polymorphospora sp. NPDC050346 TaxID=3155780 RepID=UPI0033FD9093